MIEDTGESEGEGEYASPTEAADAIRALTTTDRAKLDRIARFFARTRLQAIPMTAGDLFQEAVVRTLTGDRTWRKGVVTMVRHLDRAMESISSHFVEGAQNSLRPESFDVLEFEVGDDSNPKAGLLHSSVEVRASVREEMTLLENLFVDDPSSWRLLECRLQGKKEAEILRDLGISKREYDAIAKRIRRKIVRSK